MSRFDMFARALAVGHFREAFSVFLAEDFSPGGFCKQHACSAGNDNCPVGCHCNTNLDKCVGSK